jgi:hypothetical protein
VTHFTRVRAYPGGEPRSSRVRSSARVGRGILIEDSLRVRLRYEVSHLFLRQGLEALLRNELIGEGSPKRQSG